MPNEFKVKNGLIVDQGGAVITGSLIAPNITGSLLGTASYALVAQTLLGTVTSASYAQTASYVLNAVSSSFAANGGVTQIIAGSNITVSPTTGKGQVTISSTGGGGSSFNTATGSYGSFYDTTTQTNPVANIPRSMSLNTTAISNGVSVSGSINPFNTYIKTENPGVYDIQFSAQLDKTDSGADEIVIWLRKNNINLTDTATTITLIGNNGKQVAAWNWFVNSAANDYYQIIWQSADTDVRLLAEPQDGHPGIPSVIVTVNRVDQFLSNTGSFSGSFTGNFTGSLLGTATTASYVLNAVSASFATTSSFAVSSSRAVTSSFALTASFLLGGAGSSITIADEGVSQGTATFLNFIGSGVTATVSANTASINIAGGGGSAFPFTGSAVITGSLRIIGPLTVTGSLNVTGSITGSSDARINGITFGRGGGNSSFNIAVGLGTLGNNTTGISNLAFGAYALGNNTTGINNIAIGATALSENTTGGNNIALGFNSIAYGGQNTISIGYEAGYFGSIPDGDGNDVPNYNPVSSIYIGTGVRPLDNTQSNQIVIGEYAVGLGSNTTVLGNSSIVTTAIRGNLLLGTTTDAGFKLNVLGTTRFVGNSQIIGSTVITGSLSVTGSVIISSLTSGSILFSSGSTIAQDNTNLFWDNTNKRLGIGTNAPNASSILDISGSKGILIPRMNITQRNNISSPAGGLQVVVTGETGGEFISMYNSSTALWVALLDDDPQIKLLQGLGSQIKAQTFDATIATTNTTMQDGQLRLFAVYLAEGQILTGVQFYQVQQGVYTADNNNKVGLYSVNASTGVLTRVAQSNNTGSIWQAAANANPKIPFSSTYLASAGVYYVALLYNNSAETTPPTILARTPGTNALQGRIDNTGSLVRSMLLATQTDLAATYTASGLTTSATSGWVSIY